MTAPEYSLLCLVLASCAPELPPQGERNHRLALPGGIASADGGTGWFSDPEGRLIAVDLEDGKVRWIGPSCRPLAATTDTVFAWRPGTRSNALVLLAMHAESGATLAESNPVELEDWVRTSAAGSRSFSIRALSATDAELRLAWRAEGGYAGGAPPGIEVSTTSRSAEGLLTFEVESGEVRRSPAAEEEEPPDRPPPEVASPRSAVYWRGDVLANDPVRVGGDWCLLETRPGGGDEKRSVLSLVRFPDNGDRQDVVLLEGEDLFAAMTLDGRYVVVGDGDDEARLVSLATGATIMNVPRPRNGRVSVIRERVFVVPHRQKSGERGQILSAYRIESGEEIWRLAIGTIATPEGPALRR